VSAGASPTGAVNRCRRPQATHNTGRSAYGSQLRPCNSHHCAIALRASYQVSVKIPDFDVPVPAADQLDLTRRRVRPPRESAETRRPWRVVSTFSTPITEGSRSRHTRFSAIPAISSHPPVELETIMPVCLRPGDSPIPQCVGASFQSLRSPSRAVPRRLAMIPGRAISAPRNRATTWDVDGRCADLIGPGVERAQADQIARCLLASQPEGEAMSRCEEACEPFEGRASNFPADG
jgi:hypothetical protein